MNEHVQLFSGSSIIINGLKNLLDNKKIPYIIKDRFESARLAGFGEQMNAVEIHVFESDKDAAEEVLAKYKEEINS